VFDEVVCFSDYGEASLAKLLNNLACAYHVAVLDELMNIAEQRGLDPRALRQVMILGSGSSYAASIIADVMGDLLAKDVELAASYVGRLPLIGVDGIEQRLARARRGPEP
jgi:3-hydroxyisobutyrate dehydrogenase-like beta-hydroxyacid dehydrogenase